MTGHVVVGAVLHREGQVFLCHRSPTRRWFPDVWDFPGGHVEPGEMPLDALAREWQEELGVEAHEIRPDPIIVMDDGDLELTVWVCTAWRGAIENRQPREHDTMRWFARAELADLTLADPAYRPALERLLS